MVNFASFCKPKACSLTVLPDRSFWRVFENLKLAVKQCYQTDHLVENAKKKKNSNETFWVIFKHCALFEERCRLGAKIQIIN